MFVARVERQIEAAHHNGPPSSKCHGNHGHSWNVVVEIAFGRAELDEFGWGVDFLLIKEVIDDFDHKDLNTHPAFLATTHDDFGNTNVRDLPPSAENLAEIIYWEIVATTEKMPSSVMVSEGKGNSVKFTNPNGDQNDPRTA